jgi:hypothetical protein
MDEAGFLGAGNDLRFDARLTLDCCQELAAVLRLPDGAGRGGEDLLNLVRFGQSAKARKRLQGGRHGL